MLSSAKVHATYQVWQEFGILIPLLLHLLSFTFILFLLYLLLAKRIKPACRLADTITLPWKIDFCHVPEAFPPLQQRCCGVDAGITLSHF